MACEFGLRLPGSVGGEPQLERSLHAVHARVGIPLPQRRARGLVLVVTIRWDQRGGGLEVLPRSCVLAELEPRRAQPIVDVRDLRRGSILRQLEGAREDDRGQLMVAGAQGHGPLIDEIAAFRFLAAGSSASQVVAQLAAPRLDFGVARRCGLEMRLGGVESPCPQRGEARIEPGQRRLARIELGAPDQADFGLVVATELEEAGGGVGLDRRPVRGWWTQRERALEFSKGAGMVPGSESSHAFGSDRREPSLWGRRRCGAR